MYSLPQLFAADVVREIGRTPYSKTGDALTDEICEALDLPVERDGTYRKPSVGRLNRFVTEDWPRCSDGFQSEFAEAAITEALDMHDTNVIVLDAVPLEASDYNLDADIGSNHVNRMDKAHIASIGEVPLFCIHTGGAVNDCTQAGNLCRRLRGTGKLWGSGARIAMDAGYCTFECLAEAFLTTGTRPHVVLKTDSVPRPEAGQGEIQMQYCRMYRHPDYDRYGKDDECCVLGFLCRHGKTELVGKYIMNREIERQQKGEPAFDTADLAAYDGLHRAVSGPIPFDIIGIDHGMRESIISFRFNAIQALSRISSARNPLRIVTAVHRSVQDRIHTDEHRSHNASSIILPEKWYSIEIPA